MKRILFCELNIATYKISVLKERTIRHLSNAFKRKHFSRLKSKESLKYKVYKHKSLLMRELGNSDMRLQENKKSTLKRVAPRIDGIIINPGEEFSFWNLVGKCSKRKGFKEGVTIKNGCVKPGIAGGMCQMTNLIHWMVLHSPLEITEHHHHHRYDLFPDFNRQIPFGTGTSIMYNYLDYRFVNPTTYTFQIRLNVSNRYLEGELRSNKALESSYHIVEKNHGFKQVEEQVFRCNEIFLKQYNKKTGSLEKEVLILKNKSQVLYDLDLVKTISEVK